MKTNLIDFQELANDAMRALAREREQLIEKVEKKNALLKMMENMEEIIAEEGSFVDKCEAIICKALDAGSEDDLSVVIICPWEG